MLHGYTLPRTPGGTSSLVAAPPWHFVGDALAITFEADPGKITSLLPAPLELDSPRCAAYFIEWQFATEGGEEFLDPPHSQYRETLFLVSARFEGLPVSYCPFIWVDQDISMMRGFLQGWPKQLGSTWISRSHDLPSPASSVRGPGGRFGASLGVKERRLADARVILRESSDALPEPGFARAVNVRYFPDLAAGRCEHPILHDLVQLKSRDVRVSQVWKGDAELSLHPHPTLELSLLQPACLEAGYRFSVALTVEELVVLRDLRDGGVGTPQPPRGTPPATTRR